MKPKTLKVTLLVSLSLMVITILWASKEHATVQALCLEHKTLSQQAKEIGRLKKRWSTQESQIDFDFLKNHLNLVKQEKRGRNVYFEYENLSMSEFDQLSNKILNSMLVVKKLTLRRNNASKGTILVEIEA
ncbi:MAG: hypothetical protein WC680_02380 [Sulfuricurvum sp.]|jgi:hypothetical protein